MKIRSFNQPTVAGSVLFVTLTIVAAVALLTMSYLTMLRQQFHATMRSEVWNAAIPMAEAGIEEALAHLGSAGITNLAADGWSVSPEGFQLSRDLGSGYYEVTISTNGNNRVVTSRGALPLPLAPDVFLARTIRVTTRPQGNFPYGVGANDKIDLSGAEVVDSFDSTDISASNNGRYDPARRNANAVVGTSRIGKSNILKVSACKVYGNVATGAGSTVGVSGTGSVGTEAWVDGGNLDIQAGHFRDDMNMSFAHVEAPVTAYYNPLPGTVDGTPYTYVLATGYYYLNSLLMSGAEAVVVTGDAVLRVDGKIDFTGNCHIRIKPNASLSLYMAGKDAKLSGRGVINESGDPRNFSYYGLAANEKLELSGSGTAVEFIGTVYAPAADFKLPGGCVLTGALVVNSLSVSGGGAIHVDESLLSAGTETKKYIVNSWVEL